MMQGTETQRRRPGQARARPRQQTRRRVSAPIKVGIVVVLGILVLAAIFYFSSAGGAAGKYAYQVGKPGPGQPAPEIRLASTDGTRFDLAALRGQTVMLFFQEGIGCQPCWDQIRDIEARQDQFQSLGIDKVVSITGNITGDPLEALKAKAALEKIKTPVLSDPGLTVSRSYSANQYGMMGTSADGHSFVVVGKDGVIAWRADYGGAPQYTMYVPVANLVADLRKGLGGAAP